jgi:hypothetical protein
MAMIGITTGGANLLRLRTSLATGMPQSGMGNRVFADGEGVCSRGLAGVSEQDDGDRVSAAGEAM